MQRALATFGDEAMATGCAGLPRDVTRAIRICPLVCRNKAREYSVKLPTGRCSLEGVTSLQRYCMLQLPRVR